jgi:hypothetical protein
MIFKGREPFIADNIASDAVILNSGMVDIIIFP